MILKKHLNLANAKELVVRNQLDFVRQLIKASLLKFPFQNISSFAAYLPGDRQPPGLRRLINAANIGEGGLCSHLNTFMKHQLESLGYKADLIAGCFRRTGVPSSHFMCKVTIPGHALKDSLADPLQWQLKDKTFLVDVGCGIPLHEPICFSELPYRGRAGGFDYRYERVDENTLQRVNLGGDAIIGEKPMDYLSPQDYTIDVRSRDFTYFTEPVKSVFKDKRASLHQSIYSFRYLDIQDNDFEAVCVRGTELIFITKESRRSQTFKNYEGIKPSILKYFPMIIPEQVELAVKHFSNLAERSTNI